MDDPESINPGMVIVTLVPDEPALSRFCPDCHKQFKAREEVFVSWGEEFMIHATCVVALALAATLHNIVLATPEGVYGHLREQLLEQTARARGVEAEAAQTDG
jgi:hypothetical protein